MSGSSAWKFSRPDVTSGSTLKITIASPPLGLSGGCRVIAIYAQRLKQRGHQVTIVAPAHRRNALRFFSSLRRFERAVPQPPSHFDGLDVYLHIVDRDAPNADDLPDADVVVATWWLTAEWVAMLPPSKGAKAYFIQHHEIHSYLPIRRVRATYRLPLRKIVIAQWLADVMRTDHGDADVDLVPNSVDHEQFFAPPRGRRAQPTVGLLYSTMDWKRFALAADALERVRRVLPDLRVECFGIEHPERDLPSFMNFTFDPPQSSLRDIYARCDVWLTASSSEGFNLPAMEALACRTPVVATRTGWPAEAIVDGINGACVDIDDVEALARELERLLRLSDGAWRAVSDAAYATVRDSSWERSTDLFEAALQRLLTAQSPGPEASS